MAVERERAREVYRLTDDMAEILSKMSDEERTHALAELLENDAIDPVRALLAEKSPVERVAFFQAITKGYCVHCGDGDPTNPESRSRCRGECENDE